MSHFLNEEKFNIKKWKKRSTSAFLQFYEPPGLRKNIFTAWNDLKSEVYLTCINVWKFHDHLKACLEVIRLPSWPKMWNLVSKCNFLRFWPCEKSIFELMPNFKFSFSESGPWSVHILPEPIFLFRFSNFYWYPENAPNRILSSNSAGKIWTTWAMQLKFLEFSILNETMRW